MSDFEKLLDFKNLYSSYLASMRGKGKKKSAKKFSVLALEYLCVMKRELVDHTYKVSPYNDFVVTRPKRRIIRSGSFRDKVLQHCLCDYVLLPRMRNEFVLDNCAGQIGKGTLFGLDRLSKHMLDFYAENGTNGYILKCDISKFFYSIDHTIMKSCLRKYFADKDILWLCDLIIDSAGDSCGLPLGNQCSQVFALIYLNELDHLIKGNLNCKYYGRYMDDFYLISKDKDYLKYCLREIKNHLADRSLSLNSKTEIVPIHKGIRYLGFHSYITQDGKVIRRLLGDNKRAVKKRLRIFAKLVKAGKMTREQFNERYTSWKNHASHGNCYNLIVSMDHFVESLFENKL